MAERWRRLRRNEQVILTLLAALIGIAVAYAAILFRLGVGLVQSGALGFSSERVYAFAAELPRWRLLLAPALGGLAIGLFLEFLMPGKRPQGVAEVIEAGALRGGRLPLKDGLAAAVVSAASLGVGASAGREGPIVHLGAALASAAAARFGLSPSLSLTILGCGVAAGVAASFNAPIAGVFFALEVVIGHYALHAFAPVVIASVAGTIVSRAHLGDFPAFVLPHYAVQSFLEFPAFLLLGVVSAGLAMAFMKSVMVAEDMAARVSLPNWSRPAVGGLAVGAIAIVFPHVLGVGYGATNDALRGLFPLWLLLALVVAKTVATAITLAARFGGGVFSPSLYLGAMAGAAFGLLAAAAVPGLAAETGLYAIVGMGAVAAAVLGAPISTILIVFELTGDYAVTLAVMVAVVVSSTITQQTLGRSFFHWQLERRNLDVKGGRVRHLLKSRRVGELMSDDFQLVAEGTGIDRLKALLQAAPHGHFLVVDAQGRLVGRLGFAELKDVVFDAGLDALIIARDVARRDPVVLLPDDDLEHALALLEASAEDQVPVVEDEAGMKVVGVIHHRQVLLAYNRALMEVRAEERGEA
ncbi:MAG: chloride channel protein [Alphaproteobacteria bacterium]